MREMDTQIEENTEEIEDTMIRKIINSEFTKQLEGLDPNKKYSEDEQFDLYMELIRITVEEMKKEKIDVSQYTVTDISEKLFEIY